MPTLRRQLEWHGGAPLVADELGMTTAGIYRYVQGRYEPPLVKARLLALYFGVTVDELLGVASTRSGEAAQLNVLDAYDDWRARRWRLFGCYELSPTITWGESHDRARRIRAAIAEDKATYGD